jgi:sugar transferase (PEP-CTERM/EpsH1 system associated)
VKSRVQSSGNQLRILYLAQKECIPANTGAKLRNFHLARELALRASVTYLGFSDGAHQVDDEQALLDFKRACKQVITVPFDRNLTLAKVIRGALGRTPLNVINYTTSAMVQALERVLSENDFDIVQVETLLFSPYLPIIRAACSRAACVCDWHNVESELLRRYSERAPSLAHRLYARATARKMERLERQMMAEFDAHITVSERDRQRLLQLDPHARIYVIENGVDVASYSGLNQHRHNRILFVGSMDYHANIDAAISFARQVWPAIHKRKPDLIFTIVGRNPSPSVKALANLAGIEVTGTVADVRPFYREAIAAVVPLRVGGGSRLKILEAMAAGVPVISSRLGAEGLAVKDSENIILAETAEEFCRAIFEMIRDEVKRQKITLSASKLVRSRYDWSAIGSSLFELHLKLANRAEQSRQSFNSSTALRTATT